MYEVISDAVLYYIIVYTFTVSLHTKCTSLICSVDLLFVPYTSTHSSCFIDLYYKHTSTHDVQQFLVCYVHLHIMYISSSVDLHGGSYNQQFKIEHLYRILYVLHLDDLCFLDLHQEKPVKNMSLTKTARIMEKSLFLKTWKHSISVFLK